MNENSETDAGSLAWLMSVKNAVAWLAGATAGLTALLYACGFLVMRSHLSMLGLYGFVDPDSNDYLQEGAKFVDVSITEAATSAVALLLVSLPLIGLFVLLQSWLGRRVFGDGRIGSMVRIWKQHHRVVLYSLALAILAATVVTEVRDMTRPLCIENLLYQSRAVSSICGKGDDEAAKLLGELIHRDSVGLAGHYEDALVALARVGLLCALAAWLCARWRWRQMAFAPFILGTIVIALLVPMDYGVFRREPRYPRILMTLSDHSATAPEAPLYLLDHRGSDWVVWSASTGSVVWLPGTAVASATITTIEDPLRVALAIQERKP